MRSLKNRPVPGWPPEANAIKDLAIQLTREGRWAQAVRVFRALKAGSTHPDVREFAELSMGEILLGPMERPEDAMREFEAAAAKPGSGGGMHAQSRIAEYRLETGNLRAAVEVYERVLAASPDTRESVRALDEILILQSRASNRAGVEECADRLRVTLVAAGLEERMAIEVVRWRVSTLDLHESASGDAAAHTIDGIVEQIRTTVSKEVVSDLVWWLERCRRAVMRR